MRLSKTAEKYIYSEDLNCAQIILSAANEYYNLGLSSDNIRLMYGFGGGMCIGGTCGAVTGGLAALPFIYPDMNKDDFKLLAQTYMTYSKDSFGSLECSDIKPVLHTEEEGCSKTVLYSCQILENFIKYYSYKG